MSKFDFATCKGVTNAAMFLDYYNDFLSISGFAKYYGIPEKKAKKIIQKGRTVYQDKFGHH